MNNFWVRLSKMFGKIQKRSVAHAFNQIGRSANRHVTTTRTVKVPMHNWFILQKDYDFNLKRSLGKYMVR